MQLLVTFVVLAALFAADEAPLQASGAASSRLILVLAGMGAVVLSARVISGLTALGLQQDFSARRQLLARFTQLRHMHLALWVTVGAIMFGWLDWPQLVLHDWHFAGTFLLDDLLVLAPLLLPLVLSWAAFYEVERVMQVEHACRAGRAFPADSRWQYVWCQLRAELGLLLLPLFLVLAYQDAMLYLFPTLIEDNGWFGYLPPMLVILVFFPAILRWTWGTTRLPEGPLGKRLATCSEQFGVRPRRILIWPTGGRIINAAVAGFVPRFRYVFLTDGLLNRLPEDDIESIYAHELAHVRYRHLALRVLAMIAPFGLARLIAVACGLDPRDYPWLALAVGMAFLATIYAWICRQFEFEADLAAAEYCSRTSEDAVTGDDSPSLRMWGVERFAAALTHVAEVSGGGRPALARLHPTIDDRIAWLRQLPEEPSRADRFHRRMRLLRGAIWGATWLGLAASLWMAATWTAS